MPVFDGLWRGLRGRGPHASDSRRAPLPRLSPPLGREGEGLHFLTRSGEEEREAQRLRRGIPVMSQLITRWRSAIQYAFVYAVFENSVMAMIRRSSQNDQLSM